MSPNGQQCCALEICCPPGSERRAKLAASIAQFIGDGPEKGADHCAKFLDWMEHEGLVFAPEEFQIVIDRLVTITRAHKDHDH